MTGPGSASCLQHGRGRESPTQTAPGEALTTRHRTGVQFPPSPHFAVPRGNAVRPGLLSGPYCVNQADPQRFLRCATGSGAPSRGVLVFFSARFCLMVLTGFLVMCRCGDLSGMAGSLGESGHHVPLLVKYACLPRKEMPWVRPVPGRPPHQQSVFRRRRIRS